VSELLDTQQEPGDLTRLFPQGRLKIFLGASPGVGKTFAMLQAAAERKQEGRDVVVGLVETHKRKETESLLTNLEVLPRKIINYRGKSFKELDLDGILARAPQLVLIDECAHSNLPGSRHPKRYNDILEILEHGIDVYTTLNIQHFESLKDIIEQTTHIKIRESVPDSFIQSADEVQLIDLPPDDLLQRLADGKVYVQEQAQSAIEHFFKRPNLLLLRELALRKTTVVADEEMTQYHLQQGKKGSTPISDKIMVCIGTGTSGDNLIRFASRIAERLQAKWTAVTVETPDDENRSLNLQQHLSQTLRLAEELGAEVVKLDGTNIADTLVEYAQENNVTDIIIGQSKKSFWDKIPFLVHRTIAEQILYQRPTLTLRIIPTEDAEPSPTTTLTPAFYRQHLPPYIYSLAIPLGMLFAAGKINKYTTIANITAFFFLSILWISVKFGLWPALLATTVSALAYDYFYIEPTYHIGFNNLESGLTFFSFIFAVFIVSNLTIHSRNVLSITQGRLRQIRFFSKFVHHIAECMNRDEVLRYLCQELHRFLKISVIAFWDKGENLTPTVQYPESKILELTEADRNAIQWALAHKKRSGRSTDNFSDASYLYLPIKIGNNSLGVVGIWALKSQLTVDDFRVTQTLIDQAALAIDRLHYVHK